jgi:hypothetical protein
MKEFCRLFEVGRKRKNRRNLEEENPKPNGQFFLYKTLIKI